MKAIISNKIYMTVDPTLHKKLEKELTYKIHSYNAPDNQIVIKNLSVVNYNIQGGLMLVAFPVGRTDLIPHNYEVVDKRVSHYIENFPEFLGTLRPSQAEIVDDIDDNCIINATVGFGKAQPKGSKVRVPSGWKDISEIKIGDLVITPSNTVASVTGVFPHKDKKVYKITLMDGRTVRACGEHLWKTINADNKEKVQTTEDIMNSYAFRTKKMYLPLTKPILEEHVEHYIHPYVLGCILGDGSITQGGITFSSADKEILDRLESLLPNGVVLKKLGSLIRSDGKNNYDYSITWTGSGPSPILAELKRLELLGTNSYTKFIPEAYKFGSLDNKLELIRGLMDTDGTAALKNTAVFYSISERLASDMQELFFSLGAQCTMNIKKEPKYTYKGETRVGQPCYMISPQRMPFALKKEIFYLPRKRDRVTPGQYDKSAKVRIDSIVEDGIEDCWCISLDSEDKLYITDNYTVTHNTYSGLALAAKLKQKTLVVVHTTDLRDQWEREIKKVLGISPGIIGSGRFTTDKSIVVANTQTLIKHIPKISREFGLILMDEMHHTPSPTFSKIIDASFARYKVGLSGTIERKDGKHVVLKDYFGSKIYKPEKENTMQPKVHVLSVPLGFSDDMSIPWTSKVTALAESQMYREIIVALADKYAREGHSVLAVSDRVDFLQYCHDSSKAPSELLTGSVKNREEVINNVYSGKARILWGTQSLVSEGLSINPLSCLILGTPMNNMPLLEQLIGRVIRGHPDKLDPVVVDVKLQGGTVSRQFNNRLGHYMKEGYGVEFLK